MAVSSAPPPRRAQRSFLAGTRSGVPEAGGSSEGPWRLFTLQVCGRGVTFPWPRSALGAGLGNPRLSWPLSLALVLSCYVSQNVFSKSELKFPGCLRALGSGQGSPFPAQTDRKETLNEEKQRWGLFR